LIQELPALMPRGLAACLPQLLVGVGDASQKAAVVASRRLRAAAKQAGIWGVSAGGKAVCMVNVSWVFFVSQSHP
jgi:hypothetical protein